MENQQQGARWLSSSNYNIQAPYQPTHTLYSSQSAVNLQSTDRPSLIPPSQPTIRHIYEPQPTRIQKSNYQPYTSNPVYTQPKVYYIKQPDSNPSGLRSSVTPYDGYYFQDAQNARLSVLPEERNGGLGSSVVIGINERRNSVQNTSSNFPVYSIPMVGNVSTQQDSRVRSSVVPHSDSPIPSRISRNNMGRDSLEPKRQERNLTDVKLGNFHSQSSSSLIQPYPTVTQTQVFTDQGFDHTSPGVFLKKQVSTNFSPAITPNYQFKEREPQVEVNLNQRSSFETRPVAQQAQSRSSSVPYFRETQTPSVQNITPEIQVSLSNLQQKLIDVERNNEKLIQENKILSEKTRLLQSELEDKEMESELKSKEIRILREDMALIRKSNLLVSERSDQRIMDRIKHMNRLQYEKDNIFSSNNSYAESNDQQKDSLLEIINNQKKVINDLLDSRNPNPRLEKFPMKFPFKFNPIHKKSNTLQNPELSRVTNEIESDETHTIEPNYSVNFRRYSTFKGNSIDGEAEEMTTKVSYSSEKQRGAKPLELKAPKSKKK